MDQRPFGGPLDAIRHEPESTAEVDLLSPAEASLVHPKAEMADLSLAAWFSLGKNHGFPGVC